MKSRTKVVAVSIVFGLLVWVGDALLARFYFHQGTFLESLITDVPDHKVYVRLLVLVYFVVLGLLMSMVISKNRRAEEALQEYSERLAEMVEKRTTELQKAQERLIRQERLAALGQLSGGIAHELRTPLGAIGTATHLLNRALKESAPEPQMREVLEMLEKEVWRAETIINSLLGFACAKPATWREVDINEVIQETLQRAPMPESVEVVSWFDGSVTTILADPDQLGLVFGNIILNAIQAMPAGGRLSVKTARLSGSLARPNPQAEGSKSAGVAGEPSRCEWVAISFTDTGVGISRENVARLFEPLFTTRAKGIGLGLAVVKTLVEGHGGTVEVESEEGKGSTFTVKLPLAVTGIREGRGGRGQAAMSRKAAGVGA